MADSLLIETCFGQIEGAYFYRDGGHQKTTRPTRTEKFDKIPVHVFSDAHCAVPQQTTLPKHLQIKATTKALYFPPDSTSDKGGKKMAKR